MKQWYQQLNKTKQYFVKVVLIWLAIMFLGHVIYLAAHFGLNEVNINTFRHVDWYYQTLIVLLIAVAGSFYLASIHSYKNRSAKTPPNKPIAPAFDKKNNLNILNQSHSHSGFVVNSYQTGNKNNCEYKFNIVEKRSLLLQGQTGAGKTTKVIIPSIVNLLNNDKKSSILVTDPKGEIFNYTGAIAKNNGYDVRVLNLRNHLHSHRWNPFIDIFNSYKNNTNFNEKIEKFVEKMIFIYAGHTHGNDDFWKGSASDLGSAIIWSYLEVLKATGNLKIEHFTFNNILSCINNINQFVVFAKDKLTEKNDAVQALNIVAGKNITHGSTSMFQGYKQNLTRAFKKFIGHSTKNLINGDDINILDFRKKPMIIYVIFPDEAISNSSFIGIFIQMVWENLMNPSLTTEQLNHPCYLILDEFANLPLIEGINNKISNSRGKNISLLLALQGFSALIHKYDDLTLKTIIDNSDVLILGANNSDDAKLLSEMCGSKIIKVLAGQTSSQHTDRSSESTNYQHREVFYFDANDIRQLKSNNQAIYKNLDHNYGQYTQLLIYDKLNLPINKVPEINTGKAYAKSVLYFTKDKIELNDVVLDDKSEQGEKKAGSNSEITIPNADIFKLAEKYVAAKKLGQTNKASQFQGRIKSAKIDPEHWKNCCKKVEKQIANDSKYWDKLCKQVNYH